MKKLFFLASCSALVLSSCSNEIDETGEIPLVNGAAEIRIDAYTPGMTRAAKDQMVRDDEISIIASYNGTVDGEVKEIEIINSSFIFTGEKWESTETDEEGNPVQFYWPNNTDDVEFLATYHGTSSEAYFDDDKLWNIQPSGEDDLMAAYIKTKQTPNGAVNLSLNHILSDVSINVSGGVAGYIYKIKSVELISPDGAKYDIANNKYTEYNTELDENGNAFVLTTVYDMTSSTEGTRGFTLDDSNKTKELGSKLIIPSRIPGSDLLGDATIAITYQYGLTETAMSEDVPVEGEINVTKGYKYTINASLNPGAQAITFNISAAKWETAAAEDINL